MIALSIGGFRDITPVDGASDDEVEQAAVERVRARRERINLAAIGVMPGAVLTFSRDPSRTVQVVPGNKVMMGGQELTLSRAAITALQQMGYQTSNASGSQYWKYEGESLDERRQRMEVERFNEAG